MEKLNQVMLYVDDVDKAKAFWTETLEFVVISETPLAEDYVAVEVSPTKDAETSLTIMAKEFIEKYSPEVNLGTPSLMFKEKNFDALYSKLNDLGLTGHLYIDFRIEFQYEGFIFIVLCNRLHKSFDFFRKCD